MFRIYACTLRAVEAVNDLQLKIPYCNATSVLLAEGEVIPPGIGGNCIKQSRSFAEAVSPHGWTVTYLKDIEGDNSTHRACLAEKEGVGSYYVDLVLLLQKPVSLDQLPRGREVSFASYPGTSPKFCPVNVTRTDNILCVKKFCLSEKGGPIIDYRFRLDKAKDTLPSDDDIFTASRQKSRFDLTILPGNDGILEVRYYIQKNAMEIHRLGGPYGRSSVSELTGEKIPEKTLLEVSGAVQLSPQELRDFFNRAANAYRRIRSTTH